MEYLIAFFPLIFLVPKRFVRASQKKSLNNILLLLEGREGEPLGEPCELFKVAKLLLEMRKIYGSKVKLGLSLLKQETLRLKRNQKQLQGLMRSAYFQQFTMLSLIVLMVFITNTMFETPVWCYVSLVLFQIVALVFLHLGSRLLSKLYIHAGHIRFNNLLIVQCLSISGLSVSKVLSHIDWKELDRSSNKKYQEWDQLLSLSLSKWQMTGRGLKESLDELSSELEFLRESQRGVYKDYMEGVKFISLIISGFLSYFVYLYGFMSQFIN